MIFKNSFLVLITFLLVACGEYESTTEKPTEPLQEEQAETVTVTLSGKITYDFVPFKSGLEGGLDYANTQKRPIRGAVVEIIDRSGTMLKRTNTNEKGNYSVTVTSKQVKVRVRAQLKSASYNFQVKDNTNSNALYVMDGRLANLGSKSTQTRNLNASSGWDGNGYSATRVAAPFAILDVVYQGIERVTTAQSDAIFPPLNIFWSKNNIAANGNTGLGQIVTSHYNGDEKALYILGKANSDTDEYDSAVIAHEWGHYYESAFSRSDSIGGAHGTGDMLDIRVAFGEGFGTAMGCIIIDSPLYIDSYGDRQKQSFGADLEAKTPYKENPGWFSEASIYRILYDIYDTHDDEGDTLSLGFTPIHKVFIDAQKNTPAFTSIFTFITALKAQNSDYTSEIDAITLNERIEPIVDIYGTGRANRGSQNASPLYASLPVGGSVDILTNYSATSSATQNKLGIYNFIKFDIATAGTYTINIKQVGGTGRPDPDFYIYTGSSTTPVDYTEAEGVTDSVTTYLKAGTYRMSVIVYDQNSNNTFNITLN